MISVTELDVSVTVETFGPSGRHLEFFETDSHIGKCTPADADHPQTEKSVHNMLQNPLLAYTLDELFSFTRNLFTTLQDQTRQNGTFVPFIWISSSL